MDLIGQYDVAAAEEYYHLKDHLGNIRVTIDDNWNVLSYNDYYPFGLQMTGRTYNQGLENDLYKYSSKELDEETRLGWYYFGARFYDMEVGRWFVTDPLGEYPSPYVYVGNNPGRFTDFFGLASDDTTKAKGTKDDPIPLQPVVVVAIKYDPLTSSQKPGILPGGFAAFILSRVLGEVTPASDVYRSVSGLDPFSQLQLTVAERKLAAASASMMLLPVGKFSILLKGLNPLVAKSGMKFFKKATTKASNFKVEKIGQFTKFSYEVSGKGTGQSKAVFVKIVNESGKTVRVFKDSFDRANVFQHRKIK